MTAQSLREGRMLDAALEAQTPEARRAYLDRRLRETHHLGLDALSGAPVTRKDALSKMQAASPPFAGLLAGPVGRLRRMFASPARIPQAVNAIPKRQ